MERSAPMQRGPGPAPEEGAVARSWGSAALARRSLWLAAALLIGILAGIVLLTQALGTLVLLALAIILGEAIRPPVAQLERLHIPRPLAILLIYVVTLILLGADPLTDFPDHDLATRALAGARTVIALDQFQTASSQQADVLLPTTERRSAEGERRLLPHQPARQLCGQAGHLRGAALDEEHARRVVDDLHRADDVSDVGGRGRPAAAVPDDVVTVPPTAVEPGRLGEQR